MKKKPIIKKLKVHHVRKVTPGVTHVAVDAEIHHDPNEAPPEVLAPEEIPIVGDKLPTTHKVVKWLKDAWNGSPEGEA